MKQLQSATARRTLLGNIFEFFPRLLFGPTANFARQAAAGRRTIAVRTSRHELRARKQTNCQRSDANSAKRWLEKVFRGVPCHGEEPTSKSKQRQKKKKTTNDAYRLPRRHSGQERTFQNPLPISHVNAMTEVRGITPLFRSESLLLLWDDLRKNLCSPELDYLATFGAIGLPRVWIVAVGVATLAHESTKQPRRRFKSRSRNCEEGRIGRGTHRPRSTLPSLKRP
mgnify:CR=1 FL=1